MKWYVQNQKKVLGPMSLDQLIKCKQMRLIEWTTLCCAEDSTDWKCFSDFPELSEALESRWFEVAQLPEEFTVADAQGKVLGNFSTSKIYDQLARGQFLMTYLVWSFGFKEWVPIYKFKTLIQNPSRGLDQEIIWTNQSMFD